MSTDIDPIPKPIDDEAIRQRSLRVAWILMTVGIALGPFIGTIGIYAGLPMIISGAISYRKNARPTRYWYLVLVLIVEFAVLWAGALWVIRYAAQQRG